MEENHQYNSNNSFHFTCNIDKPLFLCRIDQELGSLLGCLWDWKNRIHFRNQCYHHSFLFDNLQEVQRPLQDVDKSRKCLRERDTTASRDSQEGEDFLYRHLPISIYLCSRVHYLWIVSWFAEWFFGSLLLQVHTCFFRDRSHDRNISIAKLKSWILRWWERYLRLKKYVNLQRCNVREKSKRERVRILVIR